MWTFIFPHHEGRTPTHGYATTREAAMAAYLRIAHTAFAALSETIAI
jgi:hypothetical protein